VPAEGERICVKVRSIISPELGIPDSVRPSADDGYDAQDCDQAQNTVIGPGGADLRTRGIRDEARFRFNRIWRHWKPILQFRRALVNFTTCDLDSPRVVNQLVRIGVEVLVRLLEILELVLKMRCFRTRVDLEPDDLITLPDVLSAFVAILPLRLLLREQEPGRIEI
jgi:hypothetical protein